MKSLISFFSLNHDGQRFFQKELQNDKTAFYATPLSIRNAKKHEKTGVLAVFINSKVSARVLNRLPKLKLVCAMSTGFDNIDLVACQKRDIVVCNVPAYGENTVAEHTFALILNLSRKVHKAFERTTRGNFSTKGLMGWDLFGKTIGIIGAGRIGFHVARIAKGFGMNVLVRSPKRKPDWEKKFGARFVSLNRLLKESDIVSLHCPLNDKTRHLINKQNILLMKKTAILINTARGGIVDTRALSRALGKKLIAGAGLDVLENEDIIKEETQVLFQKLSAQQRELLLLERVMLSHQNVIITPHNAFNSREAIQRILDVTLQNIKAFKQGKPQNRVA